ncbi:N-glycosylase/DNA lyase [Armadillidium vulgare]|nr:N-glycosylase/DNA lyase [Armadillidium vulgare]
MPIKFKVPVNKTELRLDLTLHSGQCFSQIIAFLNDFSLKVTQIIDAKNMFFILFQTYELQPNHIAVSHLWFHLSLSWFEIESNKWRGVLGEEIWSLTQDEKYLYCEVVHKNEYTQTNAFVSKLDVSLAEFYKSWSQADPLFQNVSKSFPGVRILDQDPVENVFSFICSSNNNIKRAKYIEMSANVIHEKGGVDWLNRLRELPYEEAHSQILQLPGVGPKVADCVCLMSLNHLKSVPVDTHVFQIATREYLPHLKGKKSLTTKIYNEISGHFRKLFGSYAGWAHSM